MNSKTKTPIRPISAIRHNPANSSTPAIHHNPATPATPPIHSNQSSLDQKPYKFRFNVVTDIQLLKQYIIHTPFKLSKPIAKESWMKITQALSQTFKTKVNPQNAKRRFEDIYSRYKVGSLEKINSRGTPDEMKSRMKMLRKVDLMISEHTRAAKKSKAMQITHDLDRVADSLDLDGSDFENSGFASNDRESLASHSHSPTANNHQTDVINPLRDILENNHEPTEKNQAESRIDQFSNIELEKQRMILDQRRLDIDEARYKLDMEFLYKRMSFDEEKFEKTLRMERESRNQQFKVLQDLLTSNIELGKKMEAADGLKMELCVRMHQEFVALLKSCQKCNCNGKE